MKKSNVFALIMSLIMLFSFSPVSVFASSMTLRGEQSSYDFDFEEGKTFVVNFILEGNEGYNNSYFRVKYDPNVIIAVPNETSDLQNDGFITYEIIKNGFRRLFINNDISSQLNLVPSANGSDYEGKADGKKTAAELGIVLLGQYVSNTLGVYDVYDDGIFLSMTFKMVAPGNTNIDIVNAASSGEIFYGTGNVAKNVDIVPVSVSLKGDMDDTTSETTTASSETTTVKSSGSSSHDNSNSSTDAATETTTNDKKSDKDDDKTKKETSTEESTEAASEQKPSSKEDTVYFNDISRYTWAENAINALAEKKIINGIGDGMFAPAANVKRADFLIMLMNALGIDETAEESFSDVDASKYYAKAVNAAKKLGIANGDNNGNFRPEEFISRQDMMVLVCRALKTVDKELDKAENSVLDKFSDKDYISEYARESVADMVNAEIVSGTGSSIDPKSNTTRAQAAVIIYNVIA